MSYSPYSKVDITQTSSIIKLRLMQLETQAEAGEWPKVSATLRLIDDDIRYAMRVGAALSVTQSLSDSPRIVRGTTGAQS